MKFGDFVKQFTLTFLATTGMGGVLYTVRLCLENALGTTDLVALVSAVAVGVVSYAGPLCILDRTVYREVFQLLRQPEPPIQEMTWRESCNSSSNKKGKS